MRYPTLAAPSFLRPVAIFAGTTSLVQATVYIVISTLGILVDQCHITIQDTSPSLERCFVELYFHKSATCEPRDEVFNDLLSPDTMFAWVVSYLVVDIIWFVISAVMIAMTVWFWKKAIVPTLYVWSIFTMGVCCMDLAGTVYFAMQLQATTYLASKVIFTTDSDMIGTICDGIEGMLTVPALLMTLAGRFYLLWLLNAALVAVLGVSAFGMTNRNSEDQEFFDNSASSPYCFDSGESVNSMQVVRRLSIIDAWKESWKDAPQIHIPKVKGIRKEPFSYPRPEAGTSSVTENHCFAEESDTSVSSHTEEASQHSLSPPQPPQLPVPPPESPGPPTSSAPKRRQPSPPRRHPPPPPDLKPLRPALKRF